MKLLFVHQHFPGQFKALAPEMVRRGHEVRATTMRRDVPADWAGVQVLTYSSARGSTPGIHPWLTSFETQVIRGEAFYNKARELHAQGYAPDVIVAHPGWGETLFALDVWPRAKLGIYCELYYRVSGQDGGFDPEFAKPLEGDACRLRLNNLSYDLNLRAASGGLAPTRWQADSFPEALRPKIEVIHDGVDTRHLAPDPEAGIRLNAEVNLSRSDEIITFVNRNLEPMRGYHVFMRALPELLARRPKARVLIIGGKGASYGTRPEDADSWMQRCIAEVRPKIPDADWSRVHFLGNVPYATFIAVLQLSTVHVYLTYPFVLSWSLLEAMSVGCAVVASDTAPVREVIRHGETGQLIDFFDAAGLAGEVCGLLDDPERRRRLGEAARAEILRRYDLQTVCLPRQVAWVERLAASD